MVVEGDESVDMPAASKSMSYADSVRVSSGPTACAFPLVFGTRVKPVAKESLECTRRQRASSDLNKEHGDGDQDEDVGFTSWHGWSKKHKASWNKKQQRKVDGQIKSRAQQSCQSRGWLDLED